MDLRRSIFFSVMLLLLLVPERNGYAQEENRAASWLRVGVHAGVQTNLIRYTVFPYKGEFQSVTGESIVPGVLLQFRIDDAWSLQAEVSWWSQDWSVAHEGDPEVEISRSGRSMAELPFLLQYRIPFPSIPVYLAAGPMVMLGTDTERIHEVRYRSFTERGGWQVTTQQYEETLMRLAVVAEIGLDVSLAPSIAIQPALRFSQPFNHAVDEELYTLRDFSYWRARLAVLITM